MGTRTRQARGPQETPHCGADRARRWGWRRTRSEPTRSARVFAGRAAAKRRRYLNDKDEALWGIVTNGTHLRLMRDNASLTRPAYIEADLAQIFSNEDIASFAVLWLLIHRSRFGNEGAPATDCPLERWRETGSKEGEVARDRLADQVQIALKVLGSGFLEANPDLATKLKSGEVNLTEWFNELLRLVYRLIFLMVAEDRNLLHPTNAKNDARALYAQGYSLAALRKQCYRAATWDKHHDRCEGVKIVFKALASAFGHQRYLRRTFAIACHVDRDADRYHPIYARKENDQKAFRSVSNQKGIY